MGASASFAADSLPEELKELYELTERQKNKIVEYDASVLETEATKLFKGHNKIIETLTGRSKSQIRRFLTAAPNSGKNLDALNDGGNTYAKFIKQLAMSKEELEMEAIRASGDYDEELLVNIIGTSTLKEIKTLDEIYSKEKNFSLLDIFTTKCKPDSQLLKFVERIFRMDRDEGKTVDKELAARQAEIIHKAGAARLIGLDEEPIIDILATASRVQCHAINEAYQDNFKMKLERAINMKFKGNAGKLMVMWAMPIPAALVNCINTLLTKMLVDKNAVGTLLAKYNKDMMSLMDAACREHNGNKSLSEFIGKGVSGNNHAAFKGWIELPSPDKGFERILDLYLENKTQAGFSMEEILNDEEMKGKFHFLLDKQAQELKLFMIDHRMKIDANDQAILTKSTSKLSVKSPSNASLASKSVSQGAMSKQSSNVKSPTNAMKSAQSDLSALALKEVEEEENDAAEPLPTIKERTPKQKSPKVPVPDENGRISILATTKIRVPLTAKEKERRDRNVNQAYAYMLGCMEDADLDAEGSLLAEVFWNTLKGFPLEDMGLIPEEIDAIKSTSAWEQDDGRIYYYEALLEFAESVIEAIELKEKGEKDPQKVFDDLSAQKEAKEAGEDHVGTLSPYKNDDFAVDRNTFAVFSSRRTQINMYPTIPIYFRQYIVDTLAAFDYDCNGFLTLTEITGLLETINISTLTAEDFLPNNKESLEPKEAADIIFKTIKGWFTDGTDHYLCLIDKSSGAYFWYNTKDESTQWCDYTLPTEAPNTSGNNEAEGKEEAYNAEEKQATEEPSDEKQTEDKQSEEKPAEDKQSDDKQSDDKSNDNKESDSKYSVNTEEKSDEKGNDNAAEPKVSPRVSPKAVAKETSMDDIPKVETNFSQDSDNANENKGENGETSNKLAFSQSAPTIPTTAAAEGEAEQ